MDGKRLLTRKTTWLAAILGIIGLVAGSSFPESSEPLMQGTWYVLVKESMESDLILFLIPVISVIPFSDVWIKERESGFLRLYIARKGKKGYIADRVITGALSGCAAWIIAVGTVLSCYFLLFYGREIKGPWKAEGFLELLYLLLHLCLLSATLANISMTIGICFQSAYMSYGLPFVGYYLLIILHERYLEEFYVIDPRAWLLELGDWGGAQLGLWAFQMILLVMTAVIHGGCLYGACREV